MDFEILVADDDEGFLEELDGKVVAGFCELPAVPDAVPVRKEQPPQFTARRTWRRNKRAGSARDRGDAPRSRGRCDRSTVPSLHSAFFVAAHSGRFILRKSETHRAS